MKVREALLKMRLWIERELQKAKTPNQDPFVLISLSYCAGKAVDAIEADAALALLRSIAAFESQVKTYDVVRPHEGLFLIDRALAQC